MYCSLIFSYSERKQKLQYNPLQYMCFIIWGLGWYYISWGLLITFWFPMVLNYFVVLYFIGVELNSFLSHVSILTRTSILKVSNFSFFPIGNLETFSFSKKISPELFTQKYGTFSEEVLYFTYKKNVNFWWKFLSLHL